MSETKDWQLLQELLARALELPVNERQAFVDRHSEGPLRAELSELLAAAEDPEDLPAAFSPAAVSTPASTEPNVAPTPTLLASGRRVGNYLLGDLLGAGGMGEVYSAEQVEPVHRSVAIKFLRPGFFSPGFTARFERERQAMALMDHPGIARVFDVASTSDGRPYLVMELVHGAPITHYCARHGLDLRQRIELFVKVCRAVQHAHVKGVIHRDLKPSNLLVTEVDGEAVPKVIDFGIAKAVDHEATGDSQGETRIGQLIGTPEYMSPEQAMSRRDLDTRTDVYSLGVVLYELLTGTTPHEGSLARLDAEELRRALTQNEPVPPSRRLERDDVGSRPAFETFSPELDWIVARALRLERGERYQSPAELADDLERFLRDEPVEAGPLTTRYRLRKWIGRHRGVAAASTLVVFALAAFGIVSWLQYRATQRALERAEIEERNASGVADFLIELLQENDPRVSRGEPRSVRALLDSGSERLLDAEARDPILEEPALEVRLLGLMGEIYVNLGEYDASVPLLESAVVRARSELPGSEELAHNLTRLGAIRVGLGRLEEAESLLTEALELRQRVHGRSSPEVAATLDAIGYLRRQQHDYAAAITAHEEARSIRIELGRRDATYAEGVNLLGIALRNAGDLDGAIERYREATEVFEQSFGTDHPHVAMTMNNLGLAQHVRGDFAEARRTFEQMLPRRLRHLGPDHPDTAVTISNIGVLLADLGELEDAEAHLRRAIAIRERATGPTGTFVAGVRSDLARVLRARGELDSALAEDERALAIRREIHGSEHPAIASSYFNLARTHAAAGRIARARELYRRSFAIYAGLDQARRGNLALVELGLLELEQGELASAEQSLEQAVGLAGDEETFELTLARVALAVARDPEADHAERLRQLERWPKQRLRLDSSSLYRRLEEIIGARAP